MTPERLKQMKTDYSRAEESLAEVVVNAMCETYREVTGKPASDRLVEELHQVVRFRL